MWVTIDHPPLNVLDAVLMPELDDLAVKVAKDESIQVIVFQSADPDFFLVHGDMKLANDPEALSKMINQSLEEVGNEPLNQMLQLHERIRALPQLTIGKIAGLARGGGAEFLSALDMRFAAIGKAGLAQMETLVGLIPGAGGIAYLPQLVGRSRALEIITGAALFGAEEAEQYGWVNKALPANELDDYVEELVRNISKRAPGVVRAIKQAIDVSTPDLSESLKFSNRLLGEIIARPKTHELAQAALAAGIQTREVEMNLEKYLADI